MLAVQNLEVVYDDVVLALRGVSLAVPDGQVVALLGANGGGKSTLLRALSGLLDIHDGEIRKGTVTLDGDDISHLAASALARRGIKHVLEGRRVFKELTTDENLRVGAHADRRNLKANLERVHTLFPVLHERRDSPAGLLSGGEQQMLAIGRALMSDPRYLLLDEPSLGLAPKVVEQIRDIIVEINAQGTGILLVEQNAVMALSIAHHGYVLENGRVVMDRTAEQLREDADVREFYLGLGAEGEVARSFRSVKHYRRRKRWAS
ncbi:ABC transporter ATP-binding protein [Nocardioides sp. zg-536]|uniref:ABC transporter ATP-binding protein n=1 Tax=Nocardioides faecalis TaxID=2803858 RepID=A0A938XXX3_9ACTN|nr:ABC transporter ATP-binding protein [Nocardioides faecalis]MBM9458492.1 ABC transporter ATP-binding protein [Nocardioides faecalis]MBS4752823.1 ABC transporter ATP-binding protein [Nocardioides faecalis]QVI58504.1 ABC transporter ATP-binding protein [Nocardioides faecalis]